MANRLPRYLTYKGEKYPHLSHSSLLKFRRNKDAWWQEYEYNHDKSIQTPAMEHSSAVDRLLQQYGDVPVLNEIIKWMDQQGMREYQREIRRPIKMQPYGIIELMGKVDTLIVTKNKNIICEVKCGKDEKIIEKKDAKDQIDLYSYILLPENKECVHKLIWIERQGEPGDYYLTGKWKIMDREPDYDSVKQRINIFFRELKEYEYIK